MRIASPSQYQLYRRLRAGALLIELLFVLLSGLAAMLALIVLGTQGTFPKVAAAVSLLVTFLLGQVARHKYFRCPVCEAPLPRGPKQVPPSQFFNGYCPACDTRFLK